MWKGLIVAYRAPVLADGKIGREEKSPIHVADVMRMSGLNSESFEKKTSRGEVPATESSSRSGSRSGRAEVPIVGVKRAELSDGKQEPGCSPTA